MEVVMAASTTSPSPFFSSSATSASSTPLDNYEATWPRRRLPSSRLPLSGLAISRCSPRLHLHRQFLEVPSKLPLRSSHRCAVSAGPPPPLPEPPSGEDQNNAAGLQETFSRIQDSARIFFAVLFWMSLFFWASAWDGKNNIRPNKRSRFRR